MNENHETSNQNQAALERDIERLLCAATEDADDVLRCLIELRARRAEEDRASLDSQLQSVERERPVAELDSFRELTRLYRQLRRETRGRR